jgi:hypothetical protein
VGDCVACASGKYAAQGSSVCTDCAAGTYFAAANGATAAACTSCGTNANSAAVSIIHTACSCNAGYWGAALTAAGTQMTCTVMSHALGLFSSCCVLADGMPTVPVAFNLCCALTPPMHICPLPYPLQACPAGTSSSTAGATGSCSCVLCSAGKVSLEAGSSFCTDCEAGKYLASSNAGAADTCTSCGVNANSPAFSVSHTACSCNKGYWGAALTTAGTSMTCAVMSHAPASSCACRRCANGVPMVLVASDQLLCSDPTAAHLLLTLSPAGMCCRQVSRHHWCYSGGGLHGMQRRAICRYRQLGLHQLRHREVRGCVEFRHKG